MSKLTEKCLILTDIGAGMLSRLSLLNRNLASPGGRPHSLQNPEWSKIRKTLEKRFPEVDVGSVKEVPGFETFQGAAGRILDELDPIYRTFCDVREFNITVLQLLKSLPRDIMDLNLFGTPEVTRNFCRLLTLYVQLHLFWSDVGERKVLLALYACAYSCVHGKTEKGYAALAGDVEEYSEPLKRTVEELKDENFVNTLGNILVQFAPVLHQSFDVDMLRQKNVLNPIEEGDSMPLPVVKTIDVPGVEKEGSPLLHCEMCHLEDYCTWVIYGVLACPSLLSRVEVLALFKTVATDCLVVPLYRDQVLNVHTELENLATWFPPRNWSGVAIPKTLKLKQLMKDTSKEATLSAGLKHRERRSYLRGEIGTLKQLFTQLPGLLGPKFPLVMASLAMAKMEILWHFRHINQSTVKSRMKHYTQENYTDPVLSQLIGLHDELLRLVYSNGKIVENYYTEYLKGAHRKVIAECLDGIKNHGAALSLGVQEILSSILPTIDGLEASQKGKNLEGFRLDWGRVSCILAASTSNALKIDSVKKLFDRMNRVVEHSRYVDALRETVEQRSELHEVWWYREHFKQEYRICLESPESANNAVSFIRSFRVMAESNVHPFCPEEQEPIGQEAARLADDMCQQLADHVIVLLKEMEKHIKFHDSQITPMEAARRVEQRSLKKNNQGGGWALMNPGQESVLNTKGRSIISPIIKTEQNLSNILWGANRAEPIAVYDRILRPKEYVRSQLIARFVDFTKTMFDSSATEAMKAPSEVLNELQQVSAALQKCASHIDIESATLIREALFEQSCEPEVYDVSTPLKAVTAIQEMGQKSVHKIVRFYIDLLDNCENSGVVYSTSTGSFINVNPPEKKKGKHEKLQQSLLDKYAKPSEMEALVSLVGTQGARTLDSAILSFVSLHVEKIKGYLTSNEVSLGNFSHNFNGDSASFQASVDALKGTDEFLSSSIRVGNALMLRGMLHSSTGASQKNSVPLVHSALSLAASSISHEASGGGNAPSLISLARSSGIDVGYLDPSLTSSLSHLASKDMRIWGLLPFAYASSFVTSDNWTKCTYIPADDVHANGEHVIMACISGLCCTMLGTQEKAKNACVEFLRSSSSVLFRMKADEEAYSAFPLRAMFVLMEKFTEVCPLIDRSVLESYMPYTILHAAYVDMSLKKQFERDDLMDSKTAFEQ